MKTLKNILLLNAVSSAATALILIVFAPMVAQLFGVANPTAFYITGIFLLLFAGLVFYEGLQKSIRPGRVLFISALDTLWVIGSLAIVVLSMFDISFMGYCLISAVAVWVAAMAYLQSRGVKKLAIS